MEKDDQDRLRTCLAFLQARVRGDQEAMDLLAEHADLRRLVEDLAEIAVTLLGYVGDDAGHHLDLMFTALDLTRGR